MVYKKLTNVRDYKWPDYAPYFAAEAKQAALIADQTPHYYVDGDVFASNDLNARIKAEREYSQRLKTNPRTDFTDMPHYHIWSGDFRHEGK